MKTVCTRWVVLVAVVLLSCTPSHAQNELGQTIESNIDDWVGTYKYIHQHPELSTQEKETSALIASSLRRLGYEVTDHFGQYEEPDLTSYGVVCND